MLVWVIYLLFVYKNWSQPGSQRLEWCLIIQSKNCGSCYFSCTFERAALAALYGTDGGSCHFSRISACDTSGSVWYRFYENSVVFCFVSFILFLSFLFFSFCFFHFVSFNVLFLSINVAYLSIYVKRGLVVGIIKQISDGKKVDIMIC